MSSPERTSASTRRVQRLAWFLMLLWTVFVGASLAWNLHLETDQVAKAGRHVAEVAFENDVLYRKWAASHGGVYVPVSDRTPPNPYLNVPHRDLTSDQGPALTLINPAYMVRQVNEMGVQIRGTKGHITSLKPLRPENAPDDWERSALEAFERGRNEVCATIVQDGQEYIRLMRPLLAEASCLKCHAAQGYKLGDIRGGISVSAPTAPLWAIHSPVMLWISLGHALLWMTGIVGISLTTGRLRTSQERARWLARFPEESPNPVLRVSAEGVVLYRNPAAAKDPRWRCEINRVLPLEAVHKLVDRAVAEQTTVEEDVVVGGAWYAVAVSAGAEERYANVYARDVTERKRAEEALRRSNRDLRQFAYIASHDLQEPLRMVSQFMDRLRHKYGHTLDDQANEYLAFAIEGATRMTQLVDDLMQYSRVQSDQAAPTDMREVFDQAAANCRSAIDHAHAVVQCGDLPVVPGNRPQLVQLMQNLLANAVTFRRPDSPPLVRVTARRDGGHWLFCVADNGIGIAPAQSERIFQIFQRLHARDKYPGTGIGLAICKKIVEQHGGRIWVESDGRTGSTFCFTLPGE